MSDLDKMLITFGLTIFGGLLIHIFSQIFIKIFLEPCVEYKKCRSDVITYLTFYSNIFDSKLQHDDNDAYKLRYSKAKDDIRLSMAKYRASYSSIYPVFVARLLKIVPNEEENNTIIDNLLTLSLLGEFKTEGDKLFANTRLAKKTLILLGVKEVK